MESNKIIEQDFIIDRLTNSILNTISGDNFPTEVSILTLNDLKNLTKKKGWNFNWRLEFKNEKTLGAFHFKNQRMIIDSKAAKRLVEKYFKTQ